MCATLNCGRHNVKPLVVYRFYCMVLFLSQTRRQLINLVSVLSVRKIRFDILCESSPDDSHENSSNIKMLNIATQFENVVYCHCQMPLSG